MQTHLYKRNPSVVKSISTCNKCNFKDNNVATAITSGRKHTRETGHEVEIKTWCIKPFKKK